jgi:hypothetical protein
MTGARDWRFAKNLPVQAPVDAHLLLVVGTNCSTIDSALGKRYNLQEIKSGGETGFL